MSNTNTSLHLAVQNGNIDIVKMLLDAGNDLNAVNAEGQTPLDLAITTNNAEIVRLLVEHKNMAKVPMPTGTTNTVPNTDHLCKRLNVYFVLWATFLIASIISPMVQAFVRIERRQ